VSGPVEAGREVRLDLSTADPAELAYAAFYADCDHEVEPMEAGHRLALVYNLVRGRSEGRASREAKRSGARHPLKPPDHRHLVREVAALLGERTDPESPPKIVHLRDHHYTPAGLSFAALKNRDAALARVLREAAVAAGYVLHLGIVHITESGSAMPVYDPYGGRGGWGRWRGYEVAAGEDDDGDDDSDDDVEVIEVHDSERYVADWVCPERGAVDMGPIPLEEE